MLYGSSIQREKNEIDLEESFEGMKAFIDWIYTGQLESNQSPGKLCVLGGRLIAPAFPNDVIHLFFDIGFVEENLTRTVSYIWKNTTQDPKQRRYAKENILKEIPFVSYQADSDGSVSDDWSDWGLLIESGGDFVMAIAIEEDFLGEDWNHEERLYHWDNQLQCLEEINGRPIMEFLRHELRSGAK